MLISMNWISDFVDLRGLDKDALIRRFSLSAAEVENDIYYKGRDICGVVVAEIKSVEKHPASDKLHLLKVDAGVGELVDVVCGAPNVAVGMRTAFAKLGARIGDITIAPRKLAGHASNGMCCSELELGISGEGEGIMEITDPAPLGTDIKELYEIEDIIFEVDNKSLTNRPDLWGHFGIAREFATLSGRPLLPLGVKELAEYDSLPSVDLKIEDDACLRYSCLRFENISTKRSPVNMRIRLYYCGMRSINFLTDLTNYLMLEMGQPMHAFDSRRVEKIRIKRFNLPFAFKTLDGVERKIDENTLMICNDDRLVAIAGIMGGLDSEIVDDTTSLTLESATFDAVSVRKSSTRLSHRTDASMRYEKSLDPEMTIAAIGRFVKLLTDADSGVTVTSRLTDEYIGRYDKVVLDFDMSYVDRYTGIKISSDTIVNTLRSLGFGVTLRGDRFTVEVPSWRATKDVTIKADIIEEVTRIYGYDNFDVDTATAPLYPVRADAERSVEEKLKDILVKRYSLHELHSYIWAYHDEYRRLGIEIEDNIKIQDASNPNAETIRRSIIPTQLCQVKSNLSYSPDFGIFEIGRVVEGLDERGLCRERKKLAITLFSKTLDTETLYFKLLSMISVAVDDIRHKALSFAPSAAGNSYFHPKNCNAIICDGRELGKIGIIHPNILRKIDKKAAIAFLEIDIQTLVDIEDGGLIYHEASKFPSIDIDLTFLSEKFEPISKAIAASGSELIKKVAVVDRYRDEGRSKVKSITTRLTFSHPCRTLTKDEVMDVVDGIVGELKKSDVILKM